MRRRLSKVRDIAHLAADANSGQRMKLRFTSSRKPEMTVTFALRDDRKSIVQRALGSEREHSKLEEFTGFWLDTDRGGEKTTTVILRSSGVSREE